MSNVVGIAGARLNVIKDIVFAKTAIALNINAFDYPLLLRLLGAHRRREEESGADN